jgi:DNA-binding SARP family transcriptional activator/tetratricopeptide (TPR) repeat protein
MTPGAGLDPLEISVLGPTEVRLRGEGVPLGKPQVGRVVTALALRHPAASTVPVLEELLWPHGQRPAHPAQTIYTYVSNLRTALRRAAGTDAWVVATGGAYAFEPGTVVLDSISFDEEAEAGWAAADRSPAAAVEQFDRALARWRGPPYSALDSASEAGVEAARLVTQRVGVLDARARLMLDAGAGPELVAGLVTAVEENPLHERLACRLAVALYRSGRQPDALTVLRLVVERLREELGIDPTPATRAVERAILTHDDGVLAPAARAPVSVAGAATPRRPALVERLEREPFVGRQEELDALAAWWKDRTPLLLVAGEPGIGKSRLAARFVATQVPRSGLVVWVTASQLGGGALIDLTRSLLDAASVRGLVLSRTAREVLGSLSEPRDAARSGSGSDGGLPHRGRRSLITEALVEVCAALATAYDGLVVVVDDLQWTDPTTLDVLDVIGSTEPDQVRVLLTTRSVGPSEAEPDLLHSWARTGAMTSVTLAGLTEVDVAELIEGRIAQDRSSADPRHDPRLAARVVADTGGNAFFVTAVLGQVVAGGDGRLPLDVVAMVRSQLAALPPEDAELLQVASLLGETFSAPVLALVTDRPLSEVLAAVEGAVAAGLLLEGSVEGERWRHAITREAVYTAQRSAERTERHRLVAERLEREHADNLEPVLLTVARHALLGATGRPDVRHTVALAERAARYALECSLHHEAAHLAEAARTLAGAPRDRTVPGLLLIEMETLLCTGQLTALGRSVDEHWATFLRVADATQLAELVAYLDLMDFREDSGRRILTVLPLVTGDSEAHARVLTSAALSMSVVEPDRAREMLRQASDLVDALESPGDRVRWDLIEAGFLIGWSFDTLETRRALVAELATLAVVSRDLEIAASAATYERIVGYEGADLAMVDEAGERHRRFAEQLRMPRYRAGVRQRAAARLVLEGRFDEAERAASEVLEITDDEAFLAGFGAQTVAVHIERGRLGELEGLFSEYGAGLGGEGPWRATRALLLATSGRADQARAEVDAMLADGSATSPNLYLLTTLGILAMATAETGDREHARTLRTLLAPYAERVVVVSTAAVVWGATARFLAPLDLLLDDPDAALEHATLALTLHERLGARPFIARDRLALATALCRRGRPGDHDRALGLVGVAARLAEHLGMPAVASDAHALAELLGSPADGKVPESPPS